MENKKENLVNSFHTLKGSDACLVAEKLSEVKSEPLFFLKIPEFLIKHAREMKINISHIQAWYILKSINIQGLLGRKEALSALEKYFVPKTSFNKLISQDMLVLERRCKEKKYRLISYNKFFEILGYDLTPKRTKQGKFIRKGEFRVIKVETGKLLPNFRNEIAKHDLHLYINRKVYASLKRINRTNTERQLILKYVGKSSNKNVSGANLIRVFNSDRIITDICKKFYNNARMLNSLFNCASTITNKRIESELGVKRTDVSGFIKNINITPTRKVFIALEDSLHMDKTGYLPNWCSAVKGGVMVKIPKIVRK